MLLLVDNKTILFNPTHNFMNARFSEIRNTEIFAIDGSIGRVVDLLVEDDQWQVRYLVVAVNEEHSARSKRILISPAAIASSDLEIPAIKTVLDSQHINKSPLLDDNQSVSRQHELALVEHYGWPIYWFGRAVLPPQGLDALAGGDPSLSVSENGSGNLRSANEICGYAIRSRSGSAGVMNDLVINLKEWSVDHGVAESSTWLPSESSMFSTNHIDSVDWSKREITVDLSQEVLAPEAVETFDFSLPMQLGHPQRPAMG